MGAAKDDGAGIGGQAGRENVTEILLGFGPVELPRLDEFHKSGAGQAHDVVTVLIPAHEV